MRANSRAASRVRPRRRADIISPTAAARDGSAGRRRQTTRRGADVRAPPAVLNPARARPANGLMPQPASTATCSMSSVTFAALMTSATSKPKHGTSSVCRDLSTTWTASRAVSRAGRLAENRHDVYSPCRSRLQAQSWKRISENAELRLCTEPEVCVSTPAATIGRIATHEPRPAACRHDRGRHRLRRSHHRRTADVARFERLDPISLGKAPIDAAARDGPSARQCRALRYRGATSGGCRRGHRDHAVAALASCPRCRWWRRFRPRISQPSCSRRRCAGSMSFVTTIRQGTARWPVCSTVPMRPGSMRWHVAVGRRLNDDLRHIGIDALQAAIRVQSSLRILPASCFREVAAGTENAPRGSVAYRSGASCGEAGPTAFLRGRPCGKRPRPAMAAAGYFPPRAVRLLTLYMGRRRALHREAK